MNTALTNYIINSIHEGYTVAQSKLLRNTYNLTRHGQKMIVFQGWQSDNTGWYACLVDNHGASGARTSEPIKIA